VDYYMDKELVVLTVHEISDEYINKDFKGFYA
jgi:hypothetical protein